MRSRDGAWRRPTVPLMLAGLALLCAAVAALAPSTHLRTRYSWPPHTLPSGQPARMWYTPLLLARHEPGQISAHVPCDLPPALPGSEGRPVVLATTRNPAATGGLSVTKAGRQLEVGVGSTVLTRLDLSSAPGDCAYDLRLSNGSWSVTGGPAHTVRNGSVTMPVVDGLYSSLDLARGTAPAVDVTTTVHGTRSTLAQTVLRILGALFAVAALVLVSRARDLRTPRRALGARLRAFANQLRLVDVVVVIVLLGWWILGPAYFDDGWIVAGQKNFAHAGYFSSYYDSFGVGLSLQYWLEWLQHWLFGATSSLLILRLPALVCLVATWALCRWIFGRVAREAVRPAALWSLATMFIVGAFAWGMTLRPEPVVALLVGGVLACTVRFLERGTVAPLAIAAVLVALALSAHPAGLVSLAPLVVAAPALYRWGRPRLSTVATIVVAAAALVGILALLGSDLEQLRTNTASLRAHGQETAGWRDELTRYSLLSRPLYGPPLRREWVALAILAVLAYLLRRRRARADPLLDLAAPAVGVALVLLIATPSKVPWHFGNLIALAAVAVACETARLVEDAKAARGWQVRPFVVIAAAVVAAAWSWSPRNTWSDLDLRTLQWTLGVERHLTFAKAAGVAPVLLLAALALVELVRRRRRNLPAVAWRAAAWSVPVITVPVIVFTAGVFAADAAKTKSWTLTRQNLQTLGGRLDCGLADDTLVPVRSSMHGLQAVGTTAPAAWLPPTPVPGLRPFALTPTRRSAWFRLVPGRRLGFFLTGTPNSADSLALEWGRMQTARVQRLGTAAVAGDFSSDARPDIPYWRFYSAGSLPQAPAGATLVRFVLGTNASTPSGIALGLTPPVTYDDERLRSALDRGGPTLALPNLVTYFPCLRQPHLAGTAEVPDRIIAFRDSTWPLGNGTSPWDQLSDVYPLVRLPLSDSADPPGEVAVYEVERHIEGAAVAPPTATSAG